MKKIETLIFERFQKRDTAVIRGVFGRNRIQLDPLNSTKYMRNFCYEFGVVTD